MFCRLSKNASSFFYSEYKAVLPHIKPAIIAAISVEVIKKGIEKAQDQDSQHKPTLRK